ncbi:MAG: TIGR02206 family membrane protein [Phycisphaerae bacterium]|jgi:hypothetical integral membrane protein (TIGR02206 family)
MQHFAPYSMTHLLTVVACAVICLAIWRLASAPDREPGVRRWWIRGIIVVQAANAIFFATHQPFDWAVALPLQVCDIVGWVAAWSLATDRRLPRTILVFAGLLLCGQAFVTPTLSEGPATLRFWLFFATHLQVVASAFYEVIIRGYTPSLRDAAAAWGVLFAYAMLMVPLNLATGWNYGYVGPGRPGAFTAIDVLGPWPFRLLVMGVILAGGELGLVAAIRFALPLLHRRPVHGPSTLTP